MVTDLIKISSTRTHTPSVGQEGFNMLLPCRLYNKFYNYLIIYKNKDTSVAFTINKMLQDYVGKVNVFKNR